jgi:acetyl esterase/lipase
MYPEMVRQYLLNTDDEMKQNDLRLRPILATKLGPNVFPPTLNIIGWFDTLYDEGMSFARALAATDPAYDANSQNQGANNKVTNVEYGQSPHGFIGMGNESDEATWHICIALRSHFNLGPVGRPA